MLRQWMVGSLFTHSNITLFICTSTQTNHLSTSSMTKTQSLVQSKTIWIGLLVVRITNIVYISKANNIRLLLSKEDAQVFYLLLLAKAFCQGCNVPTNYSHHNVILGCVATIRHINCKQLKHMEIWPFQHFHHQMQACLLHQVLHMKAMEPQIFAHVMEIQLLYDTCNFARLIMSFL